MKRRVAITGVGVVSPLGNDPGQFFDNLSRGVSGIRRLDAATAPDGTPWTTHTHVGAPVDFDGAAHFPAPRLRMLDRISQFALFAASQAIASARLDLQALDKRRAGVFIGTGMGGAQTADDGYRTLYAEHSDRVKPFSVLMARNNAAAAWIGIDHGFLGPTLTSSTACSSSAVAIGEAALKIASGDVDVMIAGGSEAPLNIGTLVAWDAMKTLATEDGDDAATTCKPFAANRTGLVLGEGAAIVVLEEFDYAKARGATVIAELAGYGLTTDASHITRPSIEGQASAMRAALEAAQLTRSDIGYINAHGTATLANDPVETAAIRQVFGDAADRIPVSSTKSMHGHLLGAAGALELVATIMAMKHQVIPPTMNLHLRDPQCDLDYVPNRARHGVEVNAAMSNSFAFGGTNAVLICRRY